MKTEIEVEFKTCWTPNALCLLVVMAFFFFEKTGMSLLHSIIRLQFIALNLQDNMLSGLNVAKNNLSDPNTCFEIKSN